MVPCTWSLSTSGPASGRTTALGSASTCSTAATDGNGFATSTYDVTGAEALEVISWAEEQAGDDGLYAVALVGDRGGRKGLVWLQGIDANRGPGDLRHEVLRTAMLGRRGRRSVTR